MPDPGDELERILADTRAQLGRIRLTMPELEDGTPSPGEVQEWARSSLAQPALEPVVKAVAPPPPPPPPVELPSVSLAPEPAPVAAAAPAAVIERAPTPPPREPVIAAPAAPAPSAAPVRKRLAAPVAAVAALVLLAWAIFKPGSGGVVLPFADFDALTVDAAGGVIAARGLFIERKDASGDTSRLADLARPLRSLSWTASGLYGSDGTPALLRWRGPGEEPDRFVLDHAPQFVFASGDGVWTRDESGNVRQFMLNRSMTGVYLQPLDMAALPGGAPGSFAVDAAGAVLTLDASGALLRHEHLEGAYSPPSRGRVFGAGARLVPAADGARVVAPQDDGAPRLVPL